MATKTETTKRPDIEATINGYMLTFAFADGGEVTLDGNKLSEQVLFAATMHGLKQKVGDAAAISRDPETGLSATLATKRAAMQRVVDRLLSGEWNAPRGEGGSAGLLVQALMRFTGKDRANVESFLEGKTKAEQAALRRNPKIAAIIAEIQAARADASGIDSDGLLGQLTGGDE